MADTETKQATIITAILKSKGYEIHAQWSAGIVFEGDLGDYIRGLTVEIAGIPPGGQLEDLENVVFRATQDD